MCKQIAKAFLWPSHTTDTGIPDDLIFNGPLGNGRIKLRRLQMFVLGELRHSGILQTRGFFAEGHLSLGLFLHASPSGPLTCPQCHRPGHHMPRSPPSRGHSPSSPRTPADRASSLSAKHPGDFSLWAQFGLEDTLTFSRSPGARRLAEMSLASVKILWLLSALGDRLVIARMSLGTLTDYVTLAHEVPCLWVLRSAACPDARRS